MNFCRPCLGSPSFFSASIDSLNYLFSSGSVLILSHFLKLLLLLLFVRFLKPFFLCFYIFMPIICIFVLDLSWHLDIRIQLPFLDDSSWRRMRQHERMRVHRMSERRYVPGPRRRTSIHVYLPVDAYGADVWNPASRRHPCLFTIHHQFPHLSNSPYLWVWNTEDKQPQRAINFRWLSLTSSPY